MTKLSPAAVFFLPVCVFLLGPAASPSLAQATPSSCEVLCPDGRRVHASCSGSDNVCSTGGGSASGQPQAVPIIGLIDAMVKAHEKAKAQKAAALAEKVARARALNEQGVSAWKAENYTQAADLFSQALQLTPGDSVIANNLRLAREQKEAMEQRNQRQAEQNQALRRSMDRLAAVMGDVQKVESVPGLDFAGSKKLAASDPVTDSNVVDARIDAMHLQAASDYRQALGIKDPAVGERMRKGLDAVANGDWPVALAWWQDALQRDPTNPAIQRSVDLAKYTIEYRKRMGIRPSTPYDAAFAAWSKGQKQEAIQIFQQKAANNSDVASPLIAQLTDFAKLDDMLEARQNEMFDEIVGGGKAQPSQAAAKSPETDGKLFAAALKKSATDMESWGAQNIIYAQLLPGAASPKDSPEAILGMRQLETAYKMEIVAAKAAVCNCVPEEEPDAPPNTTGVPHN